MMMLGMQDDKRLPNDLATAHEVIRVQSELHKALQEALAERRRVSAERPKSPGCSQVTLTSGNARSATRVHFFVRRIRQRDVFNPRLWD
jgi:hypothetical protein